MGLKKFVKKISNPIKHAGDTVGLSKKFESTGIGRRLKSAADVQELNWSNGLKAIGHNPSRLLTGIDPASTALWNKIKGTDDKALVNVYGSPTKATYRDAESRGIDTKGARDFFKIGDSVAGFFGGSAAMGGLSKIPGSIGNGATTAGGLETFPVGDGGSSVAGGAGPTVSTGMPTSGFNFGSVAPYIGPLISGASQLYGANQAAKGAEAGIDEIRRQFDIGREDLAPYRVIGTGALNRIGALNGIGPDGQPTNAPVDYSAFRQSPGYEFNRTEQLRGVENSAAARGGLYSGNALKALQERAAGIADMGYGDYYNRLASLAGIGQTATTTGVQAGANAAGQIAGQQTTIGDIRGSGIAGAGNELANMFDTQYGRAYGRRSPSYGYRG